MSRNKKYINFIELDIAKIKAIIEQVSPETINYINNNKTSSFSLFYKNITHSDIATFGKSTTPNDLDSNLLYYFTKTDMQYIESKTGKPFETAHQSCIGLMKEWYDIMSVPNPRDQKYFLNDYINVYLVNDTISFFNSKYTSKVLAKLNKLETINTASKKREWNFEELNPILDKCDWKTKIDIHVAVHGFGIKKDTEFHKLRHHIFKGDSFILLFEKTQTDIKNLYVILGKNPLFFNIIDEPNPLLKWTQKVAAEEASKYLTNMIESYILDEDDKVSRAPQSVWKNMLADEMMAYAQEPNHIFCPFTFIDVDYDKLKTLFRASHIKAVNDPNTKTNETWDVNNGLLLTANADALFDKHLISVNPNKDLVFSKKLKLSGKRNEYDLIKELHLNKEIFQPILNAKRMEYLKYHYKLFLEKENNQKNADAE